MWKMTPIQKKIFLTKTFESFCEAKVFGSFKSIQENFFWEFLGNIAIRKYFSLLTIKCQQVFTFHFTNFKEIHRTI